MTWAGFAIPIPELSGAVEVYLESSQLPAGPCEPGAAPRGLDSLGVAVDHKDVVDAEPLSVEYIARARAAGWERVNPSEGVPRFSNPGYEG